MSVQFISKKDQIEPFLFERGSIIPGVVRVDSRLKTITLFLQGMKAVNSMIYEKCLKELKPIEDRIDVIIKRHNNAKHFIKTRAKGSIKYYNQFQEASLIRLQQSEQCLEEEVVVISKNLSLLKKINPALSSKFDQFVIQSITPKFQQEKGMKRKRAVESSNDGVEKRSDKRAKTSKDSPAQDDIFPAANEYVVQRSDSPEY